MGALRYIKQTMRSVAGDITSVIEKEVYYKLSQYRVARFILQLRQSYKNFKHTIMKMKNEQYLKETLKFRGFENEKLNGELEANLVKGLPEFTLETKSSYGKDEIDFKIHFRRGNDENYRMTKFDASMKDEQGEQKRQTFYNSRNMSTTSKEAYNLLCGRAVNKNLVNKDGEKYNAWVQLKFDTIDKYGNYPIQKYNEKWGFKLEAQLNKLPIQGLANSDDKAKLVASLNKGNSHMVYMDIDGKKEQVYLQANPSERKIDVHDKDMKPVQVLSQKEKYSAAKSEEMKSEQRQDKENGNKKNNNQAIGEDQAQKKSRKRGMTA